MIIDQTPLVDRFSNRYNKKIYSLNKMLNNIIAYVNFHFPIYKTNVRNDSFINPVSFTDIYMKNISKKDNGYRPYYV